MDNKKLLLPIKYNVIGLILLILFLASCLFKYINVNSFVSQQITDTWSENGKGSSYVSLYTVAGTKIDEFTFGSIKYMISQNLQSNLNSENYIFDDKDPFAGPFAATYSARGKISISTPDGVIADDINTYGVGGDFFIFHPVNLVTGRYFSDVDSMQDGIVIDSNTAFRLFGSYDCIDMSVRIGSNVYKILGVYEPEDSKYYKYAGADAGFVFMPYEALALDGACEDINCFEVLSVEPVSGFLYTLLNNSEKNGFPRDSYETVQVSGRFDFVNIISNVLSKWGSRSMQTQNLVYSYWENVDRAYENFYAIYTLCQIILIIFPILIIFIYVFRIINNIDVYMKVLYKRIKQASFESKKKKRKKALKNAKAIKLILVLILGSFILQGCGKKKDDEGLFKVENIEVEGVNNLSNFQIIDLGDFNILYGSDMDDLGINKEHVIYYNNDGQTLRHIVISGSDMNDQYVFDRDGNFYCLSFCAEDDVIVPSEYVPGDNSVSEDMDELGDLGELSEFADADYENLEAQDELIDDMTLEDADQGDLPDGGNTRRGPADDNNDSENASLQEEESLEEASMSVISEKKDISVDAIKRTDLEIKQTDDNNTAYLASNDDEAVINDGADYRAESETNIREDRYYFISKINFKGELVKTIRLDEQPDFIKVLNTGEDAYNDVFLVIDLENVYVFINNNLVELNHNLEFSKMIPEKKLDRNLCMANFAYSRTGELYATYNNSNYNVVLAKTKLSEGKTESGYILPGESFYTRIYNGVDYDFSIYKNGNLYAFNYKDNSYKMIADFAASNLPVDFIQSSCGIDTEHFYCVYNSLDDGMYHFGYFSKTDASSIVQKTQITVAMAESNSDIKKAAARFNKANPNYSVKILDYYAMYSTGDYESDEITVNEKLNTDIIAGNVPDVLVMTRSLSADKFINKGLFEDLYPYIDKDPELNIDDFNQHILDVYSVDGKLYRIVPGYSLMTAMIKSKYANGKTSWDLDDVKLLMHNVGCDMFVPFAERSYIMESSMMLASSQFVNWKTGECSFDNDGFKKLLEFVKGFPTQDDFMRNGMWDRLISKYDVKFRSDMVLCELSSVTSLDWYQYSVQGDFGESVSCIGFPTTDGKGNAIDSRFSLAMYSKSKNKDGCWEFMRYFLTDEYQRSQTDILPIKNSVMKDLENQALKEICFTWFNEDGTIHKEPMTYYLNGESYNIDPMKQEEIDALMDVINNTDNTTDIDRKVLKIITDESQEYFDDKATVDEVASRIQSRVQIYLYESQ